MAFSKISHRIDQLKVNIYDYVNTKLEYYELKLFEKATKSIAKLVKLLVYGSIFLMFLGFLSVGLAILIGRAIGDLSYGFFIVAGVYLVLFVCFMTFGKHFISNLLLRKFSRGILKESGTEEKEDLDHTLKTKQETSNS